MSRKEYRQAHTFDIEWIRYKREVERKSIVEIAKEMVCSSDTLRDYCHAHGIANPQVCKKLPKDLTGHQFGYLKVIRPLNKRSANQEVIWECQCVATNCGKIIEISTKGLKKGERPSCGCVIRRSNFKGFEDLSGTYYQSLKNNAKRRDIPFAISIEQMWNLFIKQGKRCAFTGENLCLMRGLKPHQRKLQTASLDRIDSSHGYVEWNVQWIHKSLQFMKNNMSDEQFIAKCRQIVNWRDGQSRRDKMDITDNE